MLSEKHGMPIDRLVLEVIERTVIDPETAARRALTEIQAQGARIALDDFGTGYSAFAYLSEIDVDIVKIDRRFIAPLPGHARTRSLAEGLITICQGLDIAVIAEGVETPEQVDFLVQRGVPYAQGFYFAHPMPAEDIDAFFRGERGDHVAAAGAKGVS